MNTPNLSIRTASATLMLIACCVGGPVLAVDYVSTSSGTLSTATIWEPNGVPTADDTVRIASGTVVTNTTTALAGITIDAGGTYYIGSSRAVGWLLNNGTLNLGNNTTARTLSLGGSLTNNGAITAPSATPTHTIAFTANSGWKGSADISTVKAGVKVNPDVTLDMSGTTTPLKFRSSGTTSLVVEGTLICGSQTINAGNPSTACSFTLSPGATLITANPNGITNGPTATLNFGGVVTIDPAASYVFNGIEPQATLGMPATANNLTISNSAGVTLSAPVSIAIYLNLDEGILTTSAGALPTMVNLGFINGSGYVAGPLAVTFSSPGTQTFPIGKGGNKRPLTFSYTGFTEASTVTVEQFETSMAGTLPAGTTQFGARYWSISRTGGAGSTFDLTLDGTGFSPAATAVILQEGAPATSYAATYSAPNYTATGIASVGNFTFGDYNPSSDRLVFTSAPLTLTAGALSGTVTVQLQTSAGTPKNAGSDLIVSLSSSSATGVFRDVADTANIYSVLIAAGTSSASLRFLDTTAGMATLSASSTGLNPATQAAQVNPGAAVKLAFTTAPSHTYLGSPVAPFVVQIQDTYDNAVPETGKSISLVLSGGTLASGTLTQLTDATGKATFPDLLYAAPVLGASIGASTDGLPSVTSPTFNVTSRVIVKAMNETDLDQADSWLGAVVPGSLDTVTVNNSSVSSTRNTVELGASASWYGLVFSNWTAATGYTISNNLGGTLTLGPGGLTGTNANHSVQLYCDLALGAPQVWDWSGTGGTLNIHQALNNNGHLLTLGGSRPVSVPGVILGAGGLVKFGTNTVTLSGLNTFTGPITVYDGTLAVQGTIPSGGGFVIAGGTVSGNGVINRGVTLNTGAVAPGAAGIGSLAINGDLGLGAGAATFIEVNASDVTSDKVVVSGNVQFGGTLHVTNIAGEVTIASTFSPVSFGGSSGDFANISGSPGPGLAWSFNPVTGLLSVVKSTADYSTNITATIDGSTLVLSWPDTHLGWTLQGQTNNLSVGLSDAWVDVPGSAASTTNIIQIDSGNPAVFFRLRNPEP